jgi:hypothetical protein
MPALSRSLQPAACAVRGQADEIEAREGIGAEKAEEELVQQQSEDGERVT